MKRTFISAILIALSVVCTVAANAQTIQDVFKAETNLTWLGIDFSGVKILGHTDIEVEDFTNRQFAGINELVLNEPKKFDLPKAFHKAGVETDLSVVKAKNKGLDPDKIKSANDADRSRFTNKTIEKMVKGYNISGKKGVGVVFIMESMSKTAERSSMYITFINMSTGKVIHTERIEEKVGGFGLRNYYAKSIYEALKDIEKTKYKDWKG
ncbi:hypothetical protein I5907_10520 [Panacibacter sp. DH6]|uniref:DUF4410 domain-containing protein n=1 Tax=Panacibacter microcysteis TaxID=2793269 RepID=A0A931E755_9BACT|nr:hypothetical protein [Panacibacter microcysteis]MBG9376671.1 hypothetical protein [Panacibacter microcysteis]